MSAPSFLTQFQSALRRLAKPLVDLQENLMKKPAKAAKLKASKPKKAPSTPPAPLSAEIAVIKTAHGEMKIEFWPDVAPQTVENFKKLASQGFYDGTAFHRIVAGFMIQGGDPLSKTDSPSVGTGGPGYKIKAEFNDRPHVRGVLSMARSQHPDSAGSQFFICLAEARFLDNQYTAFGKLIDGEETLTKIGATPTLSNGGEKSKPQTRVGVESIKIISPGKS
jgi:peptidyl-prolyl cis-trans isomerase B (cyclophilin B)